MATPGRRTRSSSRDVPLAPTPTPTTRRSTRRTRGAAAAPTPAPAPAPEVGVETEADAANTALPVLAGRTSHAYGADGRMSLTEGIENDNKLDLTGALQNTRGQAINTTKNLSPINQGHDKGASKSASPATRSAWTGNANAGNFGNAQLTKGKAKAISPIQEESEDESDIDDAPARPSVWSTRAAATAAAGLTRQASARPNNHVNSTTCGNIAIVDNTTELAANDSPAVQEPWVRGDSEHLRGDRAQVTEFPPLWYQPRSARQLYAVISMVFALLIIVSVAWYNMANSGNFIQSDQPSSRLTILDSVRSAGHKAWMSVGSAFDKNIPTVHVENSKIDELNDRFSLMDETIAELKDVLPYRIAVDKNDKQEYVIPDTFWHAIREKFNQDRDINKAAAPAWDEFVARNDRKVDDLLERLHHRGSKRIEEVFGRTAVLETQEFVNELDKNFLALHTEISQRSSKLQRQINEIMDRTYDPHQGADRPSFQVSQLAMANIVQNTNIALKSVDFFSAKLGAKINPKLTSPTSSIMGDRFLDRVFRFVNGMNPLAPINALLPWFEAGDCWCAAPGRPHGLFDLWGVLDKRYSPDPAFHPDGKPNLNPLNPPVAQLGVAMPRKVIPRSVTVEHVPKQGTLDPGAAPMWMELWGDVPNPYWHTSLEGISQRFFGSIKEWMMRTTRHKEGIHLPPTYVLLAKFRYNIDAVNHVQNFPVDIDVGDVSSAGIMKAVVRVVTNGGSDHTCIYRIRLHGDAV